MSSDLSHLFTLRLVRVSRWDHSITIAFPKKSHKCTLTNLLNSLIPLKCFKFGKNTNLYFLWKFGFWSSNLTLEYNCIFIEYHWICGHLLYPGSSVKISNVTVRFSTFVFIHFILKAWKRYSRSETNFLIISSSSALPCLKLYLWGYTIRIRPTVLHK